ncbi:hypothetical protein [Helicobacter sp. T3_23-1056]
MAKTNNRLPRSLRSLAMTKWLLSLREFALANSWQSMFSVAFFIVDCHALLCNACNDAKNLTTKTPNLQKTTKKTNSPRNPPPSPLRKGGGFFGLPHSFHSLAMTDISLSY